MTATTPLKVLLAAAERALMAMLEAGLSEAGFADLRPAHAHLFAALDPEGLRLTELAGRAGITKQSTGELVRYLERRGYLCVEPDRRDRRAKVVRPTPRGRSAHEVSVRLLIESEHWLGVQLGEDVLRELRVRLGMIIGPVM